MGWRQTHQGAAATPVTARLSRQFYERLGDEIANELVDWFNAVDTAYRNDLRELNEFNFQRFDAKVEQRFAESSAELDQRFAEFRGEIEQRSAELRVDIEQRIAEPRVEMGERFAELRVEIEERVARARTETPGEFGGLRSALADQRAELLRYMCRFWAGTLVPLAGLLIALRVL